jgi:hypothetical protein
MFRRNVMILGSVLVGAAAAGDAGAESVGAVVVTNNTNHVVPIEYRVGDSKDCLANKVAIGERDIPAGDKWQLTVHNEGIACIRVKAPGKVWWWNKVSYGKVEYYHIRD